MKKRTLLSSLSIFIVTLFSTTVFAQGIAETAANILGSIVGFLGRVLQVFFGDLSQQAGQITLVKFLFVILVGVALFEVFRRVGLKPGLSAVVGFLVSIAVVVLIPGTVLLALFTAAGSLLVLVLLALLLVPPTMFTYSQIQRRSWPVNAGLIFGWIVLGVMFTWITYTLTNATWLFFLVALYTLAMVVGIAAWGLTGTVATVATPKALKIVGAYIAKRTDAGLGTLLRDTEAVKSELPGLLKTARAQGGTWNTLTQAESAFLSPVEIDLGKIAGLLLYEKEKITDAGLKAEIDKIEQLVTGVGAQAFGGVSCPGARGGFNHWIQWIRTNFGANVPSIMGANNMNTGLGRAEELNALCTQLERFDKVVSAIDRQISREYANK